MRRFLAFVLFILSALLSFGSATQKDFDLKVEDGHSIEGLMQSQGCIVFESEPFYISVNGKEFFCGLRTFRELEANEMKRVENIFEDKLNEYSDISLYWLFLNDKHNTYIARIRAGRDPLGFYPELPEAHFDENGNLISLTSYDIYEGYFQYTIRYDDDDRVTYAEERRYDVSLTEGVRSKDFSCETKEWRYGEAGTYWTLVRKWKHFFNSDKPDTLFIMKKSDGFFSEEYKTYTSEEAFQTDNEIYSAWTQAK